MRKPAIKPLADESLGVRSMALLADIDGGPVLFDAGVSLAPSRYGFPPHPSELEALIAARKRIVEAASHAKIVFTSHYHKDHYTPPFSSLYESSSPGVFREIYSQKIVITLDPGVGTTRNQAKRARVFFKSLAGIAKIVEMRGGERYTVSNKWDIQGLVFSHGEGRLGKILAALLLYEGDPALLYLPDVQGPLSREEAQLVLKLEPDILVIGGPPLYLAGRRVSRHILDEETSNFARILKVLGEAGTQIYVSHHILRDVSWEEALEKHGVDRSLYMLYSDHYGREPELLEAYRRDLYEYNPPPPQYAELLRRYAERPPEELLRLVKGKR